MAELAGKIAAVAPHAQGNPAATIQNARMRAASGSIWCDPTDAALCRLCYVTCK
jgi:hypothetical protein